VQTEADGNESRPPSLAGTTPEHCWTKPFRWQNQPAVEEMTRKDRPE
jgi:hypothetical protein